MCVSCVSQVEFLAVNAGVALGAAVKATSSLRAQIGPADTIARVCAGRERRRARNAAKDAAFFARYGLDPEGYAPALPPRPVSVPVVSAARRLTRPVSAT